MSDSRWGLSNCPPSWSLDRVVDTVSGRLVATRSAVRAADVARLAGEDLTARLDSCTEPGELVPVELGVCGAWVARAAELALGGPTRCGAVWPVVRLG